MTRYHYSPGAAISVATVGDQGSGVDTVLGVAAGVTALVSADAAGTVPVQTLDSNGVTNTVVSGSQGFFGGFEVDDVAGVYLKFGDLQPQYHPSDEMLNALPQALEALVTIQTLNTQIADTQAAIDAGLAVIAASPAGQLLDAEGFIREERIPEEFRGGDSAISWGLEPVEGTTQTRFWIDFGDGAGRHYLTRAQEALDILAQAGSPNVEGGQLVRRDGSGRFSVSTAVTSGQPVTLLQLQQGLASAGGAPSAPEVRSTGKIFTTVDANKMIVATGSGAKDFTVPVGLDVPAGTIIAVKNDGSGTCRVVGATLDFTTLAIHPLVEPINIVTIPYGGAGMIQKRTSGNVWDYTGARA